MKSRGRGETAGYPHLNISPLSLSPTLPPSGHLLRVPGEDTWKGKGRSQGEWGNTRKSPLKYSYNYAPESKWNPSARKSKRLECFRRRGYKKGKKEGEGGREGGGRAPEGGQEGVSAEPHAFCFASKTRGVSRDSDL